MYLQMWHCVIFIFIDVSENYIAESSALNMEAGMTTQWNIPEDNNVKVIPMRISNLIAQMCMLQFIKTLVFADNDKIRYYKWIYGI
jgi:hypothetical protein